jgi:hypothetical protein
MRLSGSRRKIVLTVHIVAALGLLGASTVLLVGGLQAATRDEPEEAHAVYSLLRLLTFSVDIPLAGTRWTPVALAGVQVTMLLAAATLGVFKPGRQVRRPLARRRELEAQPEESSRVPAGVGGNSGRVMRA